MDALHESEHLINRRTENIFKQLDERSLTEEEELIIQQRVCTVRCSTADGACTAVTFTERCCCAGGVAAQAAAGV